MIIENRIIFKNEIYFRYSFRTNNPDSSFISLTAASSTVSPSTTFPPNPFQLPLPNPLFFHTQKNAPFSDQKT
jgi:hypothetical protein